MIELPEITFWWWWIFALFLLLLEIMVPGAFFIWMGVSAGIMGFLAWIFPGMSTQVEILLFSVLSVASVLIWRAYLKKSPPKNDQPTLNLRGSQYIGRHLTLSEPIINGMGKVKIDDTTWKVNGPDCPAGTIVKVVSLSNTILRVEIYKPSKEL